MKKKIFCKTSIEIGDRFGKLVVISCKGKKFFLKCDCGNKKNTSYYYSQLIANEPISCGCSKLMDKWVGRKYGKATILSAFRENNKTVSICSCECDPDVVFETKVSSLVEGKTRSCGCIKASSVEEKASTNCFTFLKYSANKRKINFELDIEYVNCLEKKNCFYCGKSPEHHKYSSNKEEGKRNGIDRTDSAKGYIESNVVSCCYFCNLCKNDLSLENFLIWVCNIYNYQNKKSNKTLDRNTNPRRGTMTYRFSDCYGNLKYRDSKKGNIFTLSKNDVLKISQENCFYCNCPPFVPVKNFISNKEYNLLYFHGLDRHDNKLGYSLSNVKSCCHPCNIAKSSDTQGVFLSKIYSIYNYLKLEDRSINNIIDYLHKFATIRL